MSSIFSISCKQSNCDCDGSHKIDTAYHYSVDEFNDFGKSIENKKIDKSCLICRLRGKFDSSSNSDTTTFTFILKQHPETLDTCWGQIEYKISIKKIVDYGIVCQ